MKKTKYKFVYKLDTLSIRFGYGITTRTGQVSNKYCIAYILDMGAAPYMKYICFLIYNT